MSALALSNQTLASFGVARNVLARFLFKDEEEAITFNLKVGTVPIDITNFTFQFRLVKQIYDEAKDTKNGYNITGRDDDPEADELDLDSSVIISDAANGQFIFSINETVTAIGEDQYNNPTIYAGYLTFGDNSSVGELVYKYPVCVVVK